MSEQCREHLVEFDVLWERCFRYRGRCRDHYKKEFLQHLTKKIQRLLTVFNNYDRAIHVAEMDAQRYQKRATDLERENTNLREQIIRLSQNGGSEASLRAAGRGVRAIEAKNDSIVGSGAGI